MVEHGVTPRGIVAFLWLELILARNNADWCRLLDLCALTDRLIAELIRSRLTVGLRDKAARGELRLLQGPAAAREVRRIGIWLARLPSGRSTLSSNAPACRELAWLSRPGADIRAVFHGSATARLGCRRCSYRQRAPAVGNGGARLCRGTPRLPRQRAPAGSRIHVDATIRVPGAADLLISPRSSWQARHSL
jgi:hypothetical protein